ncbi:MAG: alpha/beta fold hydrolase [Planctomycetota bacterium]|nr:alpha/beta fold hydrolase [Planctomycetota bacterium]
MSRNSQRLFIPGPLGRISAILDEPEGPSRGLGVFAHCFSCTKDLKAIVKISRGLARCGYTVCRFDFAGLGNSEGQFPDTTFQDNLNDVRSVVSYLAREFSSPNFLLGHSLGGSAMMATADEFDSVEAVSVIASPSDTNHLADTLTRLNPDVVKQGEGLVNTGTYEYLIRKQTVDALREYDLPGRLSSLEKRLLVFHSPADRTLGFEHAQAIADLAAGPVSILNLESANHLLTNTPEDCDFISKALSNWLDRYLSCSRS